MKKIFFPGVLLALMFVFSCTKDEYTEKEAQQAQQDLISYQDSIDQVRDSLAMVGGIIQYSVSVIPVDGGTGFVNKSAAKAQMLAGATVTVSQHGITETDTTDESGIAVFHDLRVGTLNVHVRADGYTTTNFIVEIKPDIDLDQAIHEEVVTSDGATYSAGTDRILRHAATMVPVFSLDNTTSTISGVVSYETDLTNLVPENADGVTVIAMVDVDNDEFKTNYFKSIDEDAFGAFNAPIVQIAYTELVASDVTDNGAYSIEMPSAADGLPIKLEVSDVAINQRLLLNTLYGVPVFGVQTVRTVFGSTPIPNNVAYAMVPSAYVNFSAPTGVITQQPLVDASATAVIGESGIAAIIISKQGKGYTQAPIIKINGDGTGAEAVAYVSQGKVTSVEITNAGQGYSWAEVVVLDFGDDYGTVAEASPVISYGVTQYEVTDSGDGYKSEPAVVVTSSSGSGATAKAVMSGYVSKVNVTNMGSGYVCPPSVQIDRGAGDIATAYPTMTQYNQLHSIQLTDNFTGLYETTPSVLITKVSNGSGATAVAQLSTIGEIQEIVLSNQGLGYTEAPTVLIVGGGGMGAVAQANLNTIDGSITIEVLESGSGYSSDPTIQISAPPTGGTAPVVDHVVRVFPIANITLSNTGSGYDIQYNDGANDFYDVEPDVIIDGYTLGDDEVIVRPNMKVQSIGVAGGGSGYLVPPALIITPTCGFGSGASATTEILFYVDKVVAVNSGSGYKDVDDIIVTIVTPPEGCLEQATAEAGLGSGVLESVTIDNAGLGYDAPPAVYLREYGNRIYTLNSAVSQGSVSAITFDAIAGLEEVPSAYSIEIVVVEDDAEFGTEAYPQSGKISFVRVDNPGAGYTTEPAVKFIRYDAYGDPVETGSFIDAEATAKLVDGRVVEINITNTGTGYYFTPEVVVYVPNELKKAEGTVTINADGYITGVLITNDGEGYATPPTVTFTASVPGMGSGAAATAVVSSGEVTKVVMTNNGSGYLGKNTPSSSKTPTFKPSNEFKVYAGKSYITDIYLGTGVRNEETN